MFVPRIPYPGSSFAPVLSQRTAGSGVETVPAGATSVTIEIWGGGGNGGAGSGSSNTGGGGGGGGYSGSSYASSGDKSLK